MSFLSFCLKTRICLFCLSVLQIRTCLSVSQNLSIMSSFEVEGEGNDLGFGFIDAERIGTHRLVLQMIGVSGIEAVCEAIHELQFWPYFEERHVEVAAEACLEVHVIAFESDIAVVGAGEVDGRGETQYRIRPVVTHAWRSGDEVKRTGEVDRFQVLRAVEHRVGSLSVHIVKLYMSRTKKDGRSHTELEVLGQPRFSEHTHLESVVPSALVTSDGIGLL